jgi:hypothetical protein
VAIQRYKGTVATYLRSYRELESAVQGTYGAALQGTNLINSTYMWSGYHDRVKAVNSITLIFNQSRASLLL